MVVPRQETFIHGPEARKKNHESACAFAAIVAQGHRDFSSVLRGVGKLLGRVVPDVVEGVRACSGR